DLRKRYNTLYKEAKYEQAEMAALKAHDLDPDNPVPSAALYTAKTMKNQMNFNRSRDSKEEQVLKGLDDAEYEGPYVGDVNKAIHFDKETREQNKERRDYLTGSKINNKSRGDLEQQKDAVHRLKRRATHNLKDASLGQAS